jgi:hypothetical protein
MLRRWSKLEKDFYNKKKGNFEISKIPDIYDSIKYDLMHNRSILNFENAYNLYQCSKALADVVIPQEYGMTKDEKLKIAQGIVTPLLKKIRADLACNLTGIWEDELINQLDPNYSKGILSPGRHVRTRLYFTSESHIYSLLTVLKYGNLFEDKQDSQYKQWESALHYLSTVPELNYLTQIVIMLYEDPSIDDLNSEKRFHVEIHFSPGAYADFDAPKYSSMNHNSTSPTTSTKETTNEEEEIVGDLSSSLGSNKSTNTISPTRSTGPIADKRSTPYGGSTLSKKLPIRILNKELHTLHEPPSSPDSAASLSYPEISTSEHCSLANESKPRSFEEDNLQNRIKNIKGVYNVKPKEATYNHYNTFHGSGSAASYLPLSHVFKAKSHLHGQTTNNSSPDLNQNLNLRNKKTLPTIYQELIKVRCMRPLETLHNNLCFKNFNNFLKRNLKE